MNIALAYNGNSSLLRLIRESSLLADLAHLPTTHMSEVNSLLIAYWLQELGHEVSFITRSKPSAQTHFDTVPLYAGDYDGGECLFIFKVHGLKLVKELGLLKHSWKRVIAWLDCPKPDNVLGDEAEKIDTFFWGTVPILSHEAPRWPNATHVLCEHATAFASPVELSPSRPRGLYAGRLPKVYLSVLANAVLVAPVLTYALWVETGSEKILLRPGQYEDVDLEWARRKMPPGIELEPGGNMVQLAPEASACAFGLCPATCDSGTQILSASKFYDYTALGLPVVLADATPEAAHVQQNPDLGVLYQQGNLSTLTRAIHSLVRQCETPAFMERRHRIQEWTFSQATYKERAYAIARCL